MAGAMDLGKFGRGSARLAEQRSMNAVNYHSSDHTAEADKPKETTKKRTLSDLERAAEGSEKRLREIGKKPTGGASERKPVKRQTQTQKHVPKAKVPEAETSGSTAASPRSRAAYSGVLKRAPATETTKATVMSSTTRQQKTRSQAEGASALPSPPASPSKLEDTDHPLVSDSESELSDVASDFDPQTPPAGVTLPFNSHALDSSQTNAPQDDQMSASDTATLVGDAEVENTEPVAPTQEPAGENVESPIASADESIVVEHRRTISTFEPEHAAETPAQASQADERLAPSHTPASLSPRIAEEIIVAPQIQGVTASLEPTTGLPPSQSEPQARQKRRRTAPKRPDFVVTPEEDAVMLFQPASDTAPQEESDADDRGLPTKKRKTSTAPPSAAQPQTPKKAASGTKRPNGRQKKPATSWNKSVDAQTRIVKLRISPAALRKLPKTPPPSVSKPGSNTPPKQPRKQASKGTPKTPASTILPPTPESVPAEPARPELLVDLEKYALSQLLTAREPLGSKPQAQGQPLVWAESRQALCETLPYFKRPQGGCYQNDSHVYGFLFDSVGHCREYLDEDIIICRAGGSMEQDPSGGMVQKKDQSMKEAQVLAVLNDIAHQNPLIVICGNRNGGAKCEMPHQYSVLGWYKPVAVWEEKTAGRGKKIWTTVKYRLERLNQAGEPVPWHAPAGSDLATVRASADPVYRQPCADCGKEFDQVYLQGWMCLNSACDHFWKLNGFTAPSGNTGLDYNPDFLLSRAPAWGDESVPPASLRPPIPDVGDIIGDDLAYVNTRGVCCPKCGRCNSRRLFDRWVCENPSCDYELRPQHRPVMPTHLHTPWDVAPTLVRNKVESSVHLKVEHKHGYKVCTYTFDGIDGCFIHAAATKSVLSAPGGPDEMMANLQSEDLGLERRVFATTKMSGGKQAEPLKPVGAPLSTLPSPPNDEQQIIPPVEEEERAKEKRTFEEGDLMTAFSMNYGMPYKFVASGASRSFEASPKAVKDCRYRLNWAARTLLNKGQDVLDFNEELIFTYLEGQKIEYHDDGEDGLGPEIASLSLGGRAKMHMRMKLKHYVGCSKTGILTEEKPMPCSIDGHAMYQKRLAAWHELQDLKSDSAAYNKRRKELPKELGIFDKRTKKADDLVTITLSHGDIMVMDGYDIQRYLEHKVVPEGYLRFALTCRTVLEDHLKPEERPGYEVQPDEGMYDGSVGF